MKLTHCVEARQDFGKTIDIKMMSSVYYDLSVWFIWRLPRNLRAVVLNWCAARF